MERERLPSQGPYSWRKGSTRSAFLARSNLAPASVFGRLNECRLDWLAFYEQSAYDEQGQPLTGSFMDYLLPTALEVPAFEIGHVETPSPFTEYGVKGGGEGGRMIAPAAIASAIEDALAPFGVRVDEVPLTPERTVKLVEAARR